ncbi:MAG: long-chain-fatty-acid--CoA ligase [Herpetosiphonaceae bacterium]|nr:MAG: long-chain-fatty-acid--CoA ligase [Herpetosiphonaceae bacterium]
MNIAQHVERAQRLFPDKTALIFEQQSWTYTELNAHANRVANLLRGLGVGQGDRVALMLPNIPAFVFTYLGVQKIGAIAVSINTMLKSSEVKFILSDCGAEVLVTTGELRAQVPDDQLPDLRHVIVAEGSAANALSLDELMARASDQAQAVERERDDPAAILYTSGTTGFPKGATLSQGNLIFNSYAKNFYCGMRPEDRLLLFLPLFHCFGQNAVMNSAFNACATLILHRSFVPDQVLASIARDKPTMFFGVPTIFILMLSRAIPPAELSSLRYYFSAAAPLPVEIAQQWYETYGIVINEGYGLTETSPFACYNHPFKYKLGSVGMPIGNVELRVIDEDGREVSTGELGELIIRGPNVMLGYWNRPVETAQVLRNGWFYTGDIGRVDEQGYVYIVDRSKDMINVSGLKVYPVEVENVLYGHPAVAEAAVYGISDPIMGEMVKAKIVLKAGQSATVGELMAFCHQQLATFKVPRKIEFVTSLPKNATGKILKRVLREQE